MNIESEKKGPDKGPFFISLMRLTGWEFTLV